jgi:nucleotide-binding universal stress UspA family protein
MGELLVCVDFSETTDRVLAAATRLAGPAGLTARVVHIAAAEAELAGYDKESFEAATPDKRAGQLRDEHGTLAELTERLRAAGSAVADPVLVMGRTAEEILRLADDDGAELIVVGSHGHGGLHHLLVGSTTDALLRRATVPVVVVPARA